MWCAGKRGTSSSRSQGCERKTWEINRGKRAWGEPKLLWDRQNRQERATRVLAFPVRHPEYSEPLWVVVVRQGKGREPWYLLTNEPVLTAEHAWHIVFSYVRRWKVEEAFRVEKSELRIETLRLQHWDAQHNMLLLVTLACSFLFAMCDPSAQHARNRLLRQWCPRSDWRLAQAKLPVYRLRWALSALWTAHPPHVASCRPYRSPTHITWPVGSLAWWMTLWNQLDFLVEQVD